MPEEIKIPPNGVIPAVRPLYYNLPSSTATALQQYGGIHAQKSYAFPVTEGFSLTLKATGGKGDFYTAKLIIAYIIVSSPMPAREKRVI
ncbi:hypothetical protein QZQ97_21690 [Serratia sp. root2]|uniref:hypothetical protein n=1 Tax=Serratia sp. root2 TaxID=3059676 RepID=UPI00288FA73B|nr:hypothetical protein [Serratia sp. root2]MDT3253533.1 hypothetical protein [Serratia sp. root2]